MYARRSIRKVRRTTRPKAAASRSRRYTRRRTGRRARTTANLEERSARFMVSLDQLYNEAIYLSTNHTWQGFRLLTMMLSRLVPRLPPLVPPSTTTPTDLTPSSTQWSKPPAALLQYDVLAAVFKAYTVYAVKVDVNFYNPTLDGMNVGLRVRLPSAPDTSGMYIADLREQPRTILKQLNNTGSQSTRTSFYIRVCDIFGVTATQYQDGFYSAAVTSNPAAPTPTLEPFAISTIANGAATVRYNLRMTYYVRFYDPFQPLTIV